VEITDEAAEARRQRITAWYSMITHRFWRWPLPRMAMPSASRTVLKPLYAYAVGHQHLDVDMRRRNFRFAHIDTIQMEITTWTL
jgi:hypothetical protein